MLSEESHAISVNTTSAYEVVVAVVVYCFLSLLQKGNISNSTFWSTFQEPIYLVLEHEDLELIVLPCLVDDLAPCT